MSERRNVHLQAGWLLHHRPFRDSSQILDVLTRDHGRLSLVARGSRAAKSRLRGVLRPFLPLSLSWYSRGDMGTLTGAELDGAPMSLRGDALMAAYYLNELIMNLLHRHDPQPEIHSLYGETLRRLLSAGAVVDGLREFELDLLSLLGYAVVLDRESGTGAELDGDRYYEYKPDVGPVGLVGERQDDRVFLGSELAAIERREFSDPKTLRAANRLLRRVIAYHLNGKELKSRKVLRDVRSAVGSKAT